MSLYGLGKLRGIRLALMILVLFCSSGIIGQNIVNLGYVVERGETMELLAERYRLTIDILKAVNMGIDTLYTGMKILIPVDGKYLKSLSGEDDGQVLHNLVGYFSEYQEASRMFDAGDYKRASRLYESTIQNHENNLPCDEAYFGKAMCDYRRKKWSMAIIGFEKVINIAECPEELRERSRCLMESAENKIEERRQRTANILGGILQATAEVGTAYVASTQVEAGRSTFNLDMSPQGVTLGNMSDSEFSNYINNSLVQLANYSVMQVNQQWKQEEMQVKGDFVSGYRRLHGKDPSEDEVQAAYNNYMQIKVDACNAARNAGGGNSEKETRISAGGSNHNVSSSSTTTKTCMKMSATDIAHCNGSGKCAKCNGKGRYFDTSFGLYRWVDPCVVCGGNGVCSSCHGAGAGY